VQTPNGDRAAVLIDDTGHSLATYPLNGDLATAPNASAIAWMDAQGNPTLLVAGSDDPQSLSAVNGPDPLAVAVVGDCADECEVVVQIHGRRGLGPSYAVSTTGAVARQPDAVPSVVDVSPDGTLLAGIDGYAKDDIHVCGGVYGVNAADYLWHGCEDNVFDFSPDGALIATTFSEGLGPTGVVIRDAHSGGPIHGLNNVGWVPSFAWEDSQHLLAVVVADNGATSVQRVGLDSIETVLDGYETPDEASIPVILPTVG
jgi:hypothetical protein